MKETDSEITLHKRDSDKGITSGYVNTGILVSLLFFLYLLFMGETKEQHFQSVFLKQSEMDPKGHGIDSEVAESGNRTNTSKIILLWTLTWLRQVFFRNGTKKVYTCGEYQCTFTNDRSVLYDSAAVVMTNGYVKRDDLPIYRFPRQRLILVSHESPFIDGFHTYLDGKINWTVTYHRSADISYPYGFYKRRGSDDYHTFNKGDEVKHAFKLPGVDLNITTNYKDIVKLKLRKVLALISNCMPKYRLKYIRLLKHHDIQIDLLGRCGKYRVKNLNETFYTKYKFYLAFENSYCEDYITEKLWKALRNYMLPIVMGPSIENYKQRLPPDSFIHVDNFTGPEDLASYIKYLDKNDDAYSRYHQWRADYEVLETDQEFWVCDLCRKLNENFTKRVYSDFRTFWSKSMCSLPNYKK